MQIAGKKPAAFQRPIRIQRASILAFLIALLIVLVTTPQPTLAEAGSGFGLFAIQAGLTTRDNTTEQAYAKATFGGGLDYQWALGKSFSLGISLEEIVGDASFPTLPKVSKHKISSTEVEARVWFGSLFLGYHGGTFILVAAEDLGSFELSGGKAGQGFSLGVEGRGGWFIVAQTVAVKDLQVPDGPIVDINGYRIRLGYRWR